MRALLGTIVSVAVLVASPAFAEVKVVTTTAGLAALAREVAGDRARIESLSRGIQDPHFVDANPLLAVKLRNADLLIDVGADLEIGWLPPLVTQSRNGGIQPGGPRRLTAASVVTLADLPTGPVDRSMGDLHPAGNPHFLTDPARALQVARAIAERLAAIDPASAPAYRERLADLEKRLAAATARWKQALAPVRGRKLLSRHRTLTYFLEWTGLHTAGELEPRPGVPPSPAHLATMVEVAKREGVKAIVVENYYDTKSADAVARFSGAKVVQIPGDVGGEPAVKTYEQYVDLLVARVGGTLR
jgi:zinc/manganese transport system substrate-binding protein